MPQKQYFGHNIGHNYVNVLKKNMISPFLIGGFVERAKKTLENIFYGTPCKKYYSIYIYAYNFLSEMVKVSVRGFFINLRILPTFFHYIINVYKLIHN